MLLVTHWNELGSGEREEGDTDGWTDTARLSLFLNERKCFLCIYYFPASNLVGTADKNRNHIWTSEVLSDKENAFFSLSHTHTPPETFYPQLRSESEALLEPCAGGTGALTGRGGFQAGGGGTLSGRVLLDWLKSNSWSWISFKILNQSQQPGYGGEINGFQCCSKHFSLFSFKWRKMGKQIRLVLSNCNGAKNMMLYCLLERELWKSQTLNLSQVSSALLGLS